MIKTRRRGGVRLQWDREEKGTGYGGAPISRCRRVDKNPCKNAVLTLASKAVNTPEIKADAGWKGRY